MPSKPLTIIGSSEPVSFPEIGLTDVPARIDTGARNSTIWASNIVESNGRLTFSFFAEGHVLYTGELIAAEQFTRIIVTPSNGMAEERYVVKLLCVVKGRKIRTSFTLADRSTQIYPVLVGRNILRDRFIVDISSYDLNPKEDAEYARLLRKAFEAGARASLPNKMVGPKLKIAILSKGTANYTTKRLKEVAAARGHDIRVINYAKCYLTMEKSKPVVYYKGKVLPKFDVIIPRIAQSYTKYGTAVVRQFEMQGTFSTASSMAINRSRDKLRSYQIMARQDVGIPKTVFARETANLEEIVDLAGGAPVIIKVARGTHGNGVVLAETKKAAKAVMQAFYVEGVNFIVQEFVKESAGTDIRALVVGHRVVASIIRQSLDDDFRSNTHQGGVGHKVKLTAEEERTAIKAARAMNLPFCGVDMMRSNDGPKVLEVNSSASIKTPELVTRRDVATKIIEYVERNAKAKHKKDKVGA
ncbi:MAG: RimK family alpha-L-glutamate ligase [Candidatus Saccharimonadales bacterium]